MEFLTKSFAYELSEIKLLSLQYIKIEGAKIKEMMVNRLNLIEYKAGLQIINLSMKRGSKLTYLISKTKESFLKYIHGQGGGGFVKSVHLLS